MSSEQEQSAPFGRENWKADCPQCVASKFTCDKHYQADATPDAVNADKALQQEASERELAIRARRFGSCVKCGGANGHDYALGGVFCMNPLCGRATPAPNKALMPEAAVGSDEDLIAVPRGLLAAASSAIRRGTYAEGKTHKAIQQLALHGPTIATPTPVEEPEKGVTGELVEIGAAAICRSVGNSGCATPCESCLRYSGAVLAATNAGQVEAGALREAVLDRLFANTAPIDWSDHDWNSIVTALQPKQMEQSAKGEPK